jgi:probable HAF family extracellular repeat protein
MSSQTASHDKSQVAARLRIEAATYLFLCAFLLGPYGCGGGNSNGSSPPPLPPTYTTIDAPGAGTATSQGTTPNDINAGGDIVGFFMDPNNRAHGFMRSSAGALTVLDAGMLYNQGSNARAVNIAGTVVGFFVVQQSIYQQSFTHGYIRTLTGNLTTLDVPGTSQTIARSINDGGAIAGEYLDSNQAAHGWLRASDGTLTTFDVPGSTALSFGGTLFSGISVSRINAGGIVVGFFTDANGVYHGFLRAPDGTLTMLDAPSAGTVANTGTKAADINASGVIVGSVSAAGTSHSFLRSPDGTYTIFDPPGTAAGGSSSTGVNDTGLIVGNYADANHVMHGYLRNLDSSFTSIDDPNATQSANSYGTFTTHINASGAIVGAFFDALGTQHGFVRE